jgi:putative CocE/NonD family hydrolase
VAPYFFVWLSHPAGDPWWDWAELRGRYDRVRAAVLNLSGWHDEAYGPEGAVTNFLGLRNARRAEADPRTGLVLGPWIHGGPMASAEAQSRSGERSFGAAAVIDYDETLLRFMDRYVRGIDNGVGREPRVRVFIMGENAWRTADAWPLPGTVERTLFLGGAPATGTGRLNWDARYGAPPTTSFVSDPSRPVTDPYAADYGAHDYRRLVEREDLAVFETEPLAEDLRVVGRIRAEVHVSTDAKDLDLWLKLFDVGPDGTAFNLMSPGLDLVRASYREGGRDRRLLTPGRVTAVRFENLMTGNMFRKGHRLRAVVCGAFFPHFSRNLQTGALETESAASRPARVHIHHSSGHRSRLILPVVR